MAQITIQIPDAIALRVLNAFATSLNYQPTILNEDGEPIPNPETKAQFAKRKLIEYIKQQVRQAEIHAAMERAAGEAGESADADIIIT